MPSSLSADVRIGCTALRVALDQTSPAALTHCLHDHGDDCRPERFVAWCRYQGIVPSVARVLGRTDHPLADTLAQALAPHRQAIAGASLLQAEALRDILLHLASAGLDVLPLKGVGLDVRCYGGPGKRKDGDHDLLVRPEHLPDAVRVVQELGYQRTDDAPPVEQWDDIDIHHGPPLVKHEGPMPSWIEFHWDVAPTTEGLPWTDVRQWTRALWERSTSDTLLGAPIRRLTSEDELLYLAQHAIRHFSWHGAGLSVRLAMLEDIARHIDHASALDWPTVRERSVGMGAVYIFEPIRYLWTHGLGAPAGSLIPSDVLASEDWPSSAWSRAILSARVLLGDASVPGWDEAPNRLHAEKTHRILIHSLLLRNRSDRWQLRRRELMRALGDVNEHDRRGVPKAVPDALILPLRWLRLAARSLRR